MKRIFRKNDRRGDGDDDDDENGGEEGTGGDYDRSGSQQQQQTTPGSSGGVTNPMDLFTKKGYSNTRAGRSAAYQTNDTNTVRTPNAFSYNPNNEDASFDPSSYPGGGGGSGGGGTIGPGGHSGGGGNATITGNTNVNSIRPNYRQYGLRSGSGNDTVQEGDEDGGDHHQHDGEGGGGGGPERNVTLSTMKAKHIEASAGTTRLNRILQTQGGGTAGGFHSFQEGDELDDDLIMENVGISATTGQYGTNTTSGFFGGTTNRIVRVSDPTDLQEVGNVCARYVIPPLKVDPSSIGGNMLDGYPETMVQETLLLAACSNFESTSAGGSGTGTGTSDSTILASALQFPHEYTKHKRALGLFGGSGGGGMGGLGGGGMGGGGVYSSKNRTGKRRYVIIARSTNKPLLGRPKDTTNNNMNNKSGLDTPGAFSSSDAGGGTGPFHLDPPGRKNMLNQGRGNRQDEYGGDESERADYDAMFSPEGGGEDEDEENPMMMDGEGKGGIVSPSDGNDVTATPDLAGDTPTLKGGGLNKAASARVFPRVFTGPLDTNGTPGKSLPVGRVNFDVTEEQEEISSFPVLICMTLHPDGTAPDIRKLIPLDQLTTVQDLHSTVVQLAFNNGDTIRLDFSGNVNDPNKAVERSALDKERFIWSLLQIHAILCMAVVERNSMESNSSNNTTHLIGGPSGGATGTNAMTNPRDRMYLPPLNVRNVDRAELQYVATVNGFLRKSQLLCALLERQRNLVDNRNHNNNNKSSSSGGRGTNSGDELQDDYGPDGDDPLVARSQAKNNSENNNKNNKNEESKLDMESMEEMAYDLMMGNFATRVTLFHSEEERKDAEEILNSVEWTNMLLAHTTSTATPISTTNDRSRSDHDSSANATAAATAVNVAQLLGSMLQNRMRDLEAETCRRLIAWEDEKNLSLRGKSFSLHDESDDRDTVDALALASLFKTLEALDTELLAMENWLQDRAAAIKPLTDDCADIEEENRQLEQQWKSYETLGAEMRRLLQGLEINEYTEKTLKNPASALVYNNDGTVNITESDPGIDTIYDAGKALLDAIEYPKRSGGMHLKSVSERAKGLSIISNGFCSSLAQIIVTVMEQFKSEVVAGSDHGKVSKSDTHSMIAKKIRDTQRKFQSALLGYIKLIEILAALNPEMLPALRDAYAEMVAEGILMKKRMKGYFQALPTKNVAHLNKAGKDLKDYVPFPDQPIKEGTVNAPDIRAVLGELLPVIAREAYFTSALFGSNKKEQDGREKKRNFENAKSAVDKASIHFRYYVNRTCGILDAADLLNPSNPTLTNTALNRTVDLSKVDPMLCLVATIYLNEAMDNYIDREKKGGDHSLSLAYVRATILDLRKKADKQWVAWVEKQIEWIKTHENVPLNGKRCGVFASFSRFPKYLDHLIQCCSEGRDNDYVPDLAGIKVINYYLQKIAVHLLESLKECSNRESTEKTYAANVMKMENTYFFTQSIKQRGETMSKLFGKQVMKANAICKESTDAYLGWMIKREFTTLHELFSRVSKARKEHGDREVSKYVPKDQFIKLLQKEVNRDVLKEKIGAMFVRMEKHLSEEGGLLVVAWKALVKVLYEWFGRWEKLCTSIYQHKIDPTAVDVVRIAKAAGGGSSTTTKTSKSGDPNNNSNSNNATTSTTANSNTTSEFGFKSILALGNSSSVNPSSTGGGPS